LNPPEGYTIKQINKQFFWVSRWWDYPGDLHQTWDEAVADAWRDKEKR